MDWADEKARKLIEYGWTAPELEAEIAAALRAERAVWSEEANRLRIVGRNAANQMCRAIAPDNAYTDALDELDAVVNPISPLTANTAAAPE